MESDLQKSFDLAIDENILVLEKVVVALQGPLAPERIKPQFGAITDHILDDDSLQLERAALQSGVHQHKPQRHDLAAPIEVLPPQPPGVRSCEGTATVDPEWRDTSQ